MKVGVPDSAIPAASKRAIELTRTAQFAFGRDVSEPDEQESM